MVIFDIELLNIISFDEIFQFSSVQSLSRVRLFATPWITAHQASLSITNSWSSLRLTSIESVIPSSHLILSSPSPPAPSPSQHQSLFQWVSSSHEVAKYWSFSFSIIPSKEIPLLISNSTFRYIVIFWTQRISLNILM